jgi:hypothetical protein
LVNSGRLDKGNVLFDMIRLDLYFKMLVVFWLVGKLNKVGRSVLELLYEKRIGKGPNRK